MEQYIYIGFSITKELCEDLNETIDKTTTEFLNNELEEHIQKYKNIIKNRYCYCYNYDNMPNLMHLYSKFKINEINENDSKDFIQYFWALEDGEIIIQKKTYSVKQGDIIIFPNSWVFQYEIKFKYIN
jgi:uncharacterized protein YbgA (DUF1722 family)